MNVGSSFLLLPHGSVWQSPARQFQPTWVCHLGIPEFRNQTIEKMMINSYNYKRDCRFI